MHDIRALDPAGLQTLCSELGWPAYRARQLLAWLWQKDAPDFGAMSNISRAGRETLAARFRIGRLEPAATRRAADGTIKFTLRLDDGAEVETVFIPDRDRRTICVSTQAGCALGCRFCHTGRAGLRRDLGWHEICGQVLAVRRLTRARPTNVVFMGMGEPFLNYDAVLTALAVLNDDAGLGIGARHLTVSTAGIPDRIRAYARLPLQARLAVSLNAADDETRTHLMPVNRTHPLAEVIAAVREFIALKDKRVTFEYVLIARVNDSARDADNLTRLLAGLLCKINLIPLNPFPGLELRAPGPDVVRRFAETLYPRLPAVTIRRSRGAAILAGCGQLAAG